MLKYIITYMISSQRERFTVIFSSLSYIQQQQQQHVMILCAGHNNNEHSPEETNKTRIMKEEN